MLQKKKEKGAFLDFDWIKAFSSCTVFSVSSIKKLKLKQVVYHKKVFLSDKNSFLKETRKALASSVCE